MIWAIGDIHGMLDPLSRLLTQIRLLEEADDPVKKIIFLGDYIDHGPSSKEVINLIRRLDYDTVLLAGNHKDLALRFIKGDLSFTEQFESAWMDNGGAETLLSLCEGVDDVERMRQIREKSYGPDHEKSLLGAEGFKPPKVFERFLASLKYSHAERLIMEGREVIVNFFHALPNPLEPLSEQKPAIRKELDAKLVSRALKAAPELGRKESKAELLHESRRLLDSSILWSRSYNFETGYEGEVIVHGHTPTPCYHKIYNFGDSSPAGILPQFASYQADSLLPFLFSRSPEARYRLVDREDAKRALSELNALDDWKRCDLPPVGYQTADENGVEAINIDTGAVTGGGLTALGLSPKYLEGGFLLVLTCQTDGDQRSRRAKVAQRVVKINRVGGKIPERPSGSS